MLFKFPLPGPLKGKLLPGEGLDGDRLRAGLGSWSGFRAGLGSQGSSEGIAVWSWSGFSEKKCNLGGTEIFIARYGEPGALYRSPA